MANWQSGDVEANGIRLHYTRTGGSKPPLVLAHGVTDDGLCWTPVAEALAPDYDVIMVDERVTGMQAWFAEIKRKTREQLIAEQRGAAPTWSEAELGPWADSKLRVSAHVLNVLDPKTPRTVEWPAILRNITCPALLITA